MEKEQRNRLQKATQDARRLLEEEFSSQLLEAYDINATAGRWNDGPGAHLQPEQRLIREKLVAWIEHKEAQVNDRKEALLLALREMAFTALNRFVALKLMEARQLVRPCVSGGLESDGFQEFTAVAQGLLVDQESSYRLYLETIFEDVSRELRALFDPRDPASLLWPKRTALLELLDILNRPELSELWREDETLGWIYQYFNGDAERKKMREESAAPRNSRELAVRNQFFTPRYVVEFLTDNTLGRIWYEMRQGNTGLKERCRYLVRRPNEIWLQPGEESPAEVVADEALSQEELLRQPVHIPNRPLKDPREIRMLDPACGSMHFGLYAFDLYLAIYEEAWEIVQGSDEQAKQREAFAPFVAYAADFANKAAFLLEVPKLILLHNIHGVDIDPRAAQIARLTLWLRAQRTWQEQGVEVAARPAITRSNVVCAEPMPGERELLADFVDQQFPEAERGLIQQLLEVIFDKMRLAGVAGSLLRIEEEIREAIDQARREWQKLAVHQRDLFGASESAALELTGSSLNADLQNLTKDFWIDIEERIYKALRHYAEQAKDDAYECRLFAEDAAQGFAMIDVCRKRYDVAVMNPPFGSSTESFSNYLESYYQSSKSDIYQAFTDMAATRLHHGGLLGCISSRTGFFLGSSESWRMRVATGRYSPIFIADLGYGVLDAKVETAAYVFQRSKYDQDACGLDLSSPRDGALCFRLLAESRKQQALINCTTLNDYNRTYLLTYNKVRYIPGCPFAYWLPEELVEIYKQMPALESDTRQVRVGLQTSDDFRFVRLWWEVIEHQHSRPCKEPGQSLKETWVPFAKGGEYSPYYNDIHLVVNWNNKGAEIRSYPQSKVQNDSFYMQPGVTFLARTTVRLCGTVLPRNTIFSNMAMTVFAQEDDDLRVLARLSSFVGEALLSAHHARGSEGDDQTKKYEAGIVQSLPWPSAETAPLRLAALDAFNSMRALRTRFETSRLFTCLDNFNRNTELYKRASTRIMQVELLVAQEYGLSLESAAEAAMSAPLSLSLIEKEVERELAIPDRNQGAKTNYIEILSYYLGCIVGRWDIRYATGKLQPPELPDPFEAQPVYPPGILNNSEGLPAKSNDLLTDYPLRITWPGILVIDENHPEDIGTRVRETIKLISKNPPADIEQAACEILGVKTLNDYFSRPALFFADHLKRYSKSRRQAPIYWQLSAGDGSYSAWLYYHRFTQDTLYRLLGDFVEPRIQEAEREQFELESQCGLSGDGASLLQEAQTLLQDLRLFKSELELVAPLWNPNLNDGVIINNAILWRITPYTPWQKKCKECWDKLVKGDYDWAHLAFHLWPERVIRKCTTDRSLAIAHGLDERLWQETNKGNWLAIQTSEAELQALIAEYTKPAVQNALERFLAAPPPVAAARTRAPRAAKSTSTGSTRKPRGSATPIDAEAARQILLVLTAAPAEGLGRNAIADLLGVEASALTAVIKQLKENGQIEQLGAARGAKYRLSESGRPSMESEVDA